MMLSDLLEEHGPLAATAMSSPTHTSTFTLPPQQTSPAQLAGLAPDTAQNAISYTQPLHDGINGLADQQQALTDMSAATGIAAGDLMTFQVDGQIKLGLWPRQLTFSGSAQPQQLPPQLRPQLSGSIPSLPVADPAPRLLPHAGHAELSPVPLLPSAAASTALPDPAAAEASVWPGSRQFDSLQQADSTGSALQQQGLNVPPDTATAAADRPEAAGNGTDSQPDQQLTNVAPSLSWPAAPSTQTSGLPLPASRQASGLLPPASHQESNTLLPPALQQPAPPVEAPSQEAAGAPAAPSGRQSGALSRQASRQLPVLLSRQGSGTMLPLSRQGSVAALPAERTVRAGELQQNAGNSPGQGLEQAWAALLPSLLAQVPKQHSSVPTVLPAVVAAPAVLQHPEAAAQPPTVADILQKWAPVIQQMPSGKTHLIEITMNTFHDSALSASSTCLQQVLGSAQPGGKACHHLSTAIPFGNQSWWTSASSCYYA